MRTVAIDGYLGWVTPQLISEALFCKNLRGARPEVRPDIVINWGKSNPDLAPGAWVNSPDAISLSADKAASLDALFPAEIPVPAYTRSPISAYFWYRDGSNVFGKSDKKSRDGTNITLFLQSERLTRLQFLQKAEDANIQLLTKQFFCDKEIRVHVAFGEILGWAEKVRSRNLEGHTPEDILRGRYIRSYSTGWLMKVAHGALPADIEEASIRAVNTLGLDFGAVDIRIKGRRFVILEVNSAPGLEGSVFLGKYVEAFKKAI